MGIMKTEAFKIINGVEKVEGNSFLSPSQYTRSKGYPVKPMDNKFRMDKRKSLISQGVTTLRCLLQVDKVMAVAIDGLKKGLETGSKRDPPVVSSSDD